ncbi:MAG: hypothetical protein R2857_14575 [Vampirovibrionales bacterium]
MPSPSAAMPLLGYGYGAALQYGYYAAVPGQPRATVDGGRGLQQSGGTCKACMGFLATQGYGVPSYGSTGYSAPGFGASPMIPVIYTYHGQPVGMDYVPGSAITAGLA